MMIKNQFPKLSRRSFIQKFSTATGILVFPHILKGDYANSANHRIGLGFIGAGGHIMKGHNGLSTNPNVEPLYFCDVKRDPLNRVHQEYIQKGFTGIKAVEHYEEIIEDPKVDAVMIGTPDHWHVAIAIAAMAKGKDVYVEKPMSLTVEEGKAMVEAERKYQRIVQVGSQQRSDFSFRHASELVRNGYIGDILEVHTSLGPSFPKPILQDPEPMVEGFNYDKWLGPAPYEPYFAERVSGSYRGGWRMFWEYGCRRRGDWGAHHYDITQWALDMDATGPTLFVPKGYEGEPCDYFQYQNGIKVIRDSEKYPSMITFVGSEGKIGVGRHNEFTSSNRALQKLPLKSTDQRLYESNDHRKNWLASIYSRKKAICDAQVGHRTASICQLGTIAEHLSRPIQWDPKEEKILQDPQAERFLSRPRRAGYPLPS